MGLVRSFGLVACLAVQLGCSGSYWLGHYRGDGGAGPTGPAPPPTSTSDGGAPIGEPPPPSGGGVPVPLYECTEDPDCVPVDCTCEDGTGFTAAVCDNGVCLNEEDCAALCGDVPAPNDAGAD